MRAVVQRVSQASVEVEGQTVGRIDRGMVVLLGVAVDDQPADAEALADKLLGLRIFDDQQGKMNLALAEVEGQVLVVSQFTLLGDCRKGRRPSFTDAAPPELAERLYEHFVELLRSRGVTVATGQFRATMALALVNDGPVTLLVDTRRTF
jgi:D-tyrosyl-tRNA(Tyr) deacylase